MSLIKFKKITVNTKVNIEDEDIREEKYVFQLFVTSNSSVSEKAIKNIKAICEKYLSGRYELEIIDIYKQPTLAAKENIILVPVLIKKFPLPEGRITGDLSDTESIIKQFYLDK